MIGQTENQKQTVELKLATTLNINRLNASLKRQRLSDMIKMKDPIICSPQETYFLSGRLSLNMTQII